MGYDSHDFDHDGRSTVGSVTDVGSRGIAEMPHEEQALYQEASAFEGAAIVSMIEREGEGTGNEEGKQQTEKVLEITMEDGVTFTVELDSGEKRLLELGYKQELRRVLNFWQLYAVGICSMSVFAGIIPAYGQAFFNGGPVGVIWYWWISVFFVHLVGLSFAEISSSFPTAGSLYFWAAALAGPELAPVASFYTGWMEFIGTSVGLSGVAYNGCLILQQLVVIVTDGSVILDHYILFCLSLGVILINAGITCLPIEYVATTLLASAVFQILSGVVLAVVLPMVAPLHQPASWVFGYFNNHRDYSNTPSDAYSFILALIMSQWTLYGYDGVAHLSEETKQSDRTGPIAIVGAITTISVLCWGVLISLTFCIQDPEALGVLWGSEDSPYFLPSTAVEIIWQAFHDRYNNNTGTVIWLVIIFSSFFFGCTAGILGASRTCFSLSRDRGFPLSHLWRKVNKTTGAPVLAVLLSITIGILFLLPLFGTTTIFYAITSVSTIGWVGAYAVPIFFRVIQKEENFLPGPFYMADYIGVTATKVVHLVAFLWVCYTVIVFCLPLYFPITVDNFNWAPVAIFIWLFLITVWWLLSARFWFRGPVRELDPVDVKGVAGDVAEEAEAVEFYD